MELYVLSFLLVVILIIIILILWNKISFHQSPSNGGFKSLVVIGSGGHTAEMLRLLEVLSKRYYPRLYVMTTSDNNSESKINTAQSSFGCRDYKIAKIPRSRHVNQSYFTSIFTTIYAILSSAKVVYQFRPDLILCNGPGTCVPICMLGCLYNKLFGWKCKIVFIESICRVKSLSLTGKLLMPFVDQVVVQWPELANIYPKAKYLGRLY